MSIKSVKTYKGLPVRYRIEKPRYWYVNKEVLSNEDITYEEILEPYVGVEKEIENNYNSLKIERTKLWNGKYINSGEYVFAPKGKKYFSIIEEDGVKNVKEIKGCGKIIKPSGVKMGLEMYRDEDDGEVSFDMQAVDINGNIIEPEGKDWFGNIMFPEYFNPQYYIKKFSKANSYATYKVDENDNILVNLSPQGKLSFNEKFYYNIVPETSYFDYDIRFTSKATTGSSVTTSKVLGNIGAPSWIGTSTSSGGFGVYNGLITGESLSTNTTYWFRVGETYSVSTGQYTHRIAFIKDEGYTRDSLPDEEQWSVVSSSDSTQWFNKNMEFTCKSFL